MIPPDVVAVLRLLPEPVTDVTRLGGANRPWSIRFGSTEAIVRFNDARRWQAFGSTDDEALASVEWLHALLRDLAAVGFVAPRPLDELDGRSVAMTRDGIWELLSWVPGRPMGWHDDEMTAAGSLLARFHDAAERLPRRAQRPGAQPFGECVPLHPDSRAVRLGFERDLAGLDPELKREGVIHGDATQSNVVIDDGGSYHLVDFTIAYVDHVLADLGSALWRNGRLSADAVTYDPARVARFVGGYQAIRPLRRGAGPAIVTFMSGRGLQLQRRLELRGGRDDSVMERLLAVDAAADRLAEAIETAVEGRIRPAEAIWSHRPGRSRSGIVRVGRIGRVGRRRWMPKRTRARTLVIDERKYTEVKSALGTSTLTDTVDRAFDEVLARVARARSVERLRNMEGIDLDRHRVVGEAWR